MKTVEATVRLVWGFSDLTEDSEIVESIKKACHKAFEEFRPSVSLRGGESVCDILEIKVLERIIFRA